MNQLPKWVLANPFPAVHDFESLTVIDQTARLYGAMQTLIAEYNAFADSANEQLASFTDEETEARKEFELQITKVMNEFMCSMSQYLKLNLDDTAERVFREGFENGTIKIVTDKSLSIEGVAADALNTGRMIAIERERINQIAALKEGSTTGDAELQDLRVDVFGRSWGNAGNSVRGADGIILDNVKNIAGIFPKRPARYTDTKSRRIAAAGVLSETTEDYAVLVSPTEENRAYYINAYADGGYAWYSFLDESGSPISVGVNQATSAAAFEGVVIAPAGAKNLLIGTNAAAASGVWAIVNDEYHAQMVEHIGSAARAEAIYTTTKSRRIAAAGVLSETTEDYAVLVSPTEENRAYYINAYADGGYAWYSFLDESGSPISVGVNQATSAAAFEGVVIAPAGAKNLLIGTNAAAASGVWELRHVAPGREVMIPYQEEQFKYIDLSGVVSETSLRTYFVRTAEVEPGKVYHLHSYTGSYLWYAWYDAADTFIAGKLNDTGIEATFDGLIAAPSNAKYIRYTYKSDYPCGLWCFSAKGKHSDKTWAAMGDSLTERNFRTTKNYIDYIQEATGINVVNMGHGGTGFIRYEDQNIAYHQRISSVPDGVDVVTIFASGNDMEFMGSTPIGEVTDTGTATLCGRINTTINTLFANHPLIKLGIITPAPWEDYPPTVPGNYMEVYSNTIIKICKYRGIPYLDLYRCSGLRPWEESFKAIAFSKDDGNGVHPDETGHKYIASHIKAFLESLII